MGEVKAETRGTTGVPKHLSEILLADIGGTNSRFAMLGADGRPDRFAEMRNDDLPSMEAAFARYLDTTGAKPTAAVCGFAGPILNGSVRLTNRGWTFNLADLQSRFGFSHIQGMNDFEAAAWCLLRLTPDDIHPLGTGAADATGTRVILGPGTGLGRRRDGADARRAACGRRGRRQRLVRARER